MRSALLTRGARAAQRASLGVRVRIRTTRASLTARTRVRQTIRFHLYVFLSMSVVLMLLIFWFVGEMQAAQAEQASKKKD